MSLRDRWRARTDDARRTKGDPPPTVGQLLILVKQQGEINRNLRSQVDALTDENKRLRAQVAEVAEDRDVVWTLADRRGEQLQRRMPQLLAPEEAGDPGRPYTRDYDPEATS